MPPPITSSSHRYSMRSHTAILASPTRRGCTPRLYATGISSGGYMTSRMAVSYAGMFRALAIASASYATCLGAVCSVPSVLPGDHPPTLFLHGTIDTIVPIETMRPYHERLEAQGIATDVDEDPTAGHQWLDDSPERITAWFEAH
jgi:poly(3-hydroxybutyrate) depolymerase